jgi:hypothetical protein
MILAVISILFLAGVMLFVLWVRPSDLPPAEAASPVAHLDERKAQIYENLKDLTFEYRLGKLSDADYERSKLGLQKELAGVLAEVDRILGKDGAAPAPKAAEVTASAPLTCPHCGARFDKPMKFCGECGKAMPEVTA